VAINGDAIVDFINCFHLLELRVAWSDLFFPGIYWNKQSYATVSYYYNWRLGCAFSSFEV